MSPKKKTLEGEESSRSEEEGRRGTDAIKTGRRTLVRVTTSANYAERRKRMRKGREGEDGRSVITCTAAETSSKSPPLCLGDPRLYCKFDLVRTIVDKYRWCKTHKKFPSQI